jgi:cleavage and polyadenylation specificity factor subunit 1
MTVVKNFVLLGDLAKSVFFLHFREDKDPAGGKHLLQLAKDFDRLKVMGTEFLIDGSALSLLSSDVDGNLHVFSYDRNSWQGQKLLLCAAFNLGSEVG